MNTPLIANFEVTTAASERLFQALSDAIAHGRRGLVVGANPGMGLSTALRHVAQGIRLLLAGIPVVMLHAQADRPLRQTFVRAVEGGTWGLLTFSAEDRSMKRLITQAITAGFDRCVIVVDNAERLSLTDLAWLSDLSDRLAGEGVSALVILGGHKAQLGRLEESVANVGHLDLLGRFFANALDFRGISSEADLRGVLNSLDQEYPERFAEEGKECAASYAATCWPTAFADGWRLATCAAPLWSEAIGLVSKDGELELDPLHDCLAAVMEQAYAAGPGALPPTRASWAEALSRTAFVRIRAFEKHQKR